jgi:hypothetical protein
MFCSFFTVRGYCHYSEYQGQTGEYHGLKEGDKGLKPVEHDRYYKCHQESHNAKQYFPGGHIAEQPESEAYDPDKVAEDFQQANIYINEAESKSASPLLVFDRLTDRAELEE